jgi:hypothetical protein
MAECASGASAVLACTSSAAIECSAQGVPNLLTVCADQMAAFNGCAACLPSAADDSCETCSKSSCCTERKAVYGDENLGALVECVNECVDPTCVQSCNATYPGVSQALSALVTCEQACAGCAL